MSNSTNNPKKLTPENVAIAIHKAFLRENELNKGVGSANSLNIDGVRIKVSGELLFRVVDQIIAALGHVPCGPGISDVDAFVAWVKKEGSQELMEEEKALQYAAEAKIRELYKV